MIVLAGLLQRNKAGTITETYQASGVERVYGDCRKPCSCVLNIVFYISRSLGRTVTIDN